MAYPPGWPVMVQRLIKRERWPEPVSGRCVPLVTVGQRVSPDQTIIRVEREGQESKGNKDDKSTLTRSGVGSVPDVPELVPAGLYGRVVEITRRGGVVIESYATILQGTLGAGRQVAGVLTMWHGPTPGVMERNPRMIPPGAVLVVPGPLNFALLRQAVNSGVVGIVASSISVGDLEGFLHTDMIQLLTTRSATPSKLIESPTLTILLTEGVGSATMPARVLNLLSQYQGAIVLLTGNMLPQQRIFPELIISLPFKDAQQLNSAAFPSQVLRKDALVRVCGGEHKGMIGVIDYVFSHQQVFASGIRADALRLRLEDGSLLVVPVALVKPVG
jgi:hypothetical protein